MSFLLIVIIVFSLMYGYIGWRIIIPAAFGLPISIVLWLVLAISLILPFLPHIMRFNGIEGEWIGTAARIGYLSFGFFTILFAFMLVKDIVFLITIGIIKLTGVFGSESKNLAADAVDPSRRALLVNSVNLGIVGVTGAMIGYGLYGAYRKPNIVTVDVPLKGLPDSLNGLTIAQITDIHVSHNIKRPFVENIVEQVNGLNPDIVALTGDLVDGSVGQLGYDVAPLADLQAKHGLYFVTGNHDYYSGIDKWLKEISRLGFKTLINEHEIISIGNDKLTLAGVTDYSAGHSHPGHGTDPRKAMAGAPENSPKILLAHQPKSIFEADKAGFDYMISGHTHGGQYFPYHFLVALAQPYMSGFNRHNGMALYVSKGTGFWGPQIRIGARSEITVHRLVTA